MEADLTVGPVVRVEPVVLAVGAGHRLAQRKTVSYEDLADEIVIGGAKPDYWREALVPSHTPSGRPIHVGPTVTAESELLPILSNGEAVARSCTPTPADTTPGPTSPTCPSMTPLQRGGRCCGEPPPKHLIRSFARTAREVGPGIVEDERSPDSRRRRKGS